MLGPSYQYQATMIRVIDGDTYEVAVDLGFRLYYTIHVRLHAFDTAELASKNPLEVEHAKEAKAFVAELLPVGTKLILQTVKAAAYNRWESTVWYMAGSEQISLAPVLASNGFAKKLTY